MLNYIILHYIISQLYHDYYKVRQVLDAILARLAEGCRAHAAAEWPRLIMITILLIMIMMIIIVILISLIVVLVLELPVL